MHNFKQIHYTAWILKPILDYIKLLCKSHKTSTPPSWEMFAFLNNTAIIHFLLGNKKITTMVSFYEYRLSEYIYKPIGKAKFRADFLPCIV